MTLYIVNLSDAHIAGFYVTSVLQKKILIKLAQLNIEKI